MLEKTFKVMEVILKSSWRNVFPLIVNAISILIIVISKSTQGKRIYDKFL